MLSLEMHVYDEFGNIVVFQEKTGVEAVDPKTKKKVKKEKLTEKQLTYRKVFREILLGDFGDTYRTPEYSKARYDLFQKCRTSEELNLSKKEKNLIKELLPLKFDVIISGQIINFLNTI